MMNDECRMHMGGGGGRLRRGALAGALILGPMLCAGASAGDARPTQEEFLRGMSQKVDERVDPGKALAVACAVAGTVLLLLVISRRQTRQAAPPRALNHHGKLVKEVLRRVPLKGTDAKRLKTLAETKRCSPLTLLLCPSLVQGQGKRGE